MIGRLPLLIFLILAAGCAPVKYIVRNADANYLVTKVKQEQLACIAGIPIMLDDKIPYGLQQSVNFRTYGTVPSVWVDVRAVISKSPGDMAANRINVCKKQSVESLLIKEIKHEYEFGLDTAAAIFSARLRARVITGCKGRGDRSETILVGDEPPVSGGFFGSNAKDETALVRSTTYAVYDWLSKVQEVCKAQTESENK